MKKEEKAGKVTKAMNERIKKKERERNMKKTEEKVIRLSKRKNEKKEGK